MLIRMKKETTTDQISCVRLQLEERSLVFYQTVFFEQVVLVVQESFDTPKLHDASLFWASLLDMSGVEEVLVIPLRDRQRMLTSIHAKKERTKIEVGPFLVGNGHFAIIAGPCTVENEEQLLETAQSVKKSGAQGLRGGAFKPRTSPYAFQGLREEGLKLLAKAREATGLPIVTEAMTPEELTMVAQYADVVQIGTRNMQNYRLLEAAGKLRMPILLKRGFSATIEEFLMAAEYILLGGNDQVILCERGIRTFEDDTRFTLALGAVPLLKQRTHLPIIVDPSHATGYYKHVPAMAAAATAAGADGLLIEVHPEPQKALCDGRQSLTFEEFEQTVIVCKKIREIVNATDLISKFDTGLDREERVIPVPHRLESYIRAQSAMK
ncbi:MAG: 3-deoxy-7-phosphoheptulonate synthase [Planctomycetaceae bacterium]|nr:3-deoxy-7-phosphoheptulonate synthase [Planctomycetaceae bacterium]